MPVFKAFLKQALIPHKEEMSDLQYSMQSESATIYSSAKAH